MRKFFLLVLMCVGSNAHAFCSPQGFIYQANGPTLTMVRIGNLCSIFNPLDTTKDAVVNIAGDYAYINYNDGSTKTATTVGLVTVITDATGHAQVCTKMGNDLHCN